MKRLANENFTIYKLRRENLDMAFERALLPRVLQTAVEVYHLPPKDKDPQVEVLISRGDLIVMSTGFQRDGTEIRYARSKGKPYRRFPEGRRRAEWRSIERMFK